MDVRRIKDLPEGMDLGGVKFKHPETGAECYWRSQWGSIGGKAGIWYTKKLGDQKILPLFFDKLEEALELELA